MSKISDTKIIRSETIEELLGKEEYLRIIEEASGYADDIENEFLFRTASIVIDGWHVRAKLTESGGNDSGERLSDWLDRLGEWLSDRHEDRDNGLAMTAVAWDSHLADGQEKTKTFQSLHNKQKEKYLRSRSSNYVNQRSLWLSAEWNFSDLRQVGDHFIQSGVDARMATSIIAAAYEKPNFLYVVTADQDFGPALKFASKLSQGTKIYLLTVGASVGDELMEASDESWQIYPGYRAGGFAVSIPKN